MHRPLSESRAPDHDPPESLGNSMLALGTIPD